MEGVLFYIFVNVLTASAFLLCNNIKISVSNKNSMYFRYFFLFIAYISYVLLVVMRKIDYHIGGNDALNYRIIFDLAELDLFSFFKSTREELGYKIFVWIFRRFSDNYDLFQVVAYTIIFYGFAKFCITRKIKKKDVWSFLCIFLICTNLIEALCILRVMMAISIGLVAIVYLEKFKIRRACFLSLIALSIHLSAIILIISLIIFIYLKKRKIKDFTAIIRKMIICVLSEFPFALVGSVVLYMYKDYSLYKGQNAIAIGMYLATVLIISIFNMRKYKYDESEQIVAFFALCILLCFPVQLYLSMAYRMILYFLPFLYCCVLSIIHKNDSISIRQVSINGVLMVLIMCLYIIYQMYNTYTDSFTVYGLYPYILK